MGIISANSVVALSELFTEMSEEAAKLAVLVKENPGLGFRQARSMQDDFDDLLGEIDEILFADGEGFLDSTEERGAEIDALWPASDEEKGEWSCPF